MRILVIDEQRLVLSILKDRLTDSGHQVLTSPSVAEALGTNKGGEPEVDVIIIDPGTVREVVIDAVDKIHSTFPGADILLINHVQLDGQYALSRDVFAFLRKPLHLAELALLLARIREKRGLES